MGNKIRIMVADNNPKSINDLGGILKNEQQIEVMGVYNDCLSIVKKAKALRPDMVLLDINMEGIDDMSPIELLIANVPNILVIATSDGAESRNLKKAMADGAREYIVKPFIDHVLIDTIFSIYEKDRRRKRIMEDIAKQHEVSNKPKIISIFSTKGGVGKSTLAANLAIALEKTTRENVALVDLDLQFGDISLMMNIYPERTINHLMSDIPNLDNDMLEEYLIEHPSGVKVLTAPHSPEYADFISGPAAEKILHMFKENYKYIIVDMAPAFNDINLAVLDMSEKILLLTTLELPTIKNIMIGLGVMETLKYDDKKIDIVLNRYERDTGVSIGDLEKIVGNKKLHIIPEDRNTVIQSVNSGKPFVLGKKNANITKSILAISESIAKKKAIQSKGILGRWRKAHVVDEKAGTRAATY